MLQRPDIIEYNPYFKQYIDLVPNGNLVSILKQQQKETNEIVRNVTDEQSEFRYAENKWSLKDVLGHMADTERVMSYRLLVVARGDTTPLPSFDENLYTQNANFNQLFLENLIVDWNIVRQNTISLLTYLPKRALMNRGTIFNHPTTARAIAYIIAGHELHHRRIITERYLSNSNSSSTN